MREEKEEKQGNAKPNRTEKKKLRQARKRPAEWISRGKFMSCHVFSQECGQVKACVLRALRQ
jgi:hypothetical protein